MPKFKCGPAAHRRMVERMKIDQAKNRRVLYARLMERSAQAVKLGEDDIWLEMAAKYAPTQHKEPNR